MENAATIWAELHRAAAPPVDLRYMVTKMTAGFVLVGGRSSRMGRDKALLPWNSRPMVEEIAEGVAAAAGSVALVGEPERYGNLDFERIADLRCAMGPLAGIEAALASGRAELNLIIACDMPSVETCWLVRLLQMAESSASQCVATCHSSMIHPLCAVYRSNCLAKVRSALDARRLKTQELLRELDTINIESGGTIWNVNTPEEWSVWQTLKTHNCTTPSS
jgi:molybdenum cofactor guanylyltransferase